MLTANAPETKDNDFTWKDYQARNNNELVAIFGNFINRAMKLTEKYFGGKVPACGELTDYDKSTLNEFKTVKEDVESLLDNFKFRDAQKQAMELARIGNKYLAETEPWKLFKTDEGRVATILNLALQISANLAIAFEPFLPFSAAKLRTMLGMESFEWDNLGRTDLLAEGHQLGESVLLFEKIEDDVIQKQLDRLERIKAENDKIALEEAEKNYKAKPVGELCTIDDFAKLDIRTATVTACEKVKKSDKLLKFTLDDGSGTPRTILSGIQAWYNPEDLIGKQVLFIANLAPRVMKGIESQGMILSAENFDGSISVTTVEHPVKPGSQVK